MPLAGLALVLALAAAAGGPAAAATESAASSAGSALSCETLPRLLGAYLQNHVQYRALTEELKERVAESNLRHLDPSRSLFVQSDADTLQTPARRRLRVADASATARSSRRCTSSPSSGTRRWRTSCATYVSRPDYEIDKNATLVIDPEKRGFPKNKAEREDLYRRLVHFQMSNYVANGESMDEAKKKLIHRYELMTRRAQGDEARRDLRALPRRLLDCARSALRVPLARQPRRLQDPHGSLARGHRRGALVARRLHGRRGGRARRLGRQAGQPQAEGQGDRRRPGRQGRDGRRDRHGSARRGPHDPRQEGLRGAALAAAPGRDHRALHGPPGARQDQSRRAGREAALRGAEDRRQDLQARRARPAVLLRRQGHGRASGHRRRAEAAEGSARREGRRPAARPLAQRRRPARLRREDHRLLHRQGRRGRGRRFAGAARRCSTIPTRRSSGRARSWC